MDVRKRNYNIVAGHRLQIERKKLGITQARMAEDLDICEESLRRLELGISGLSAERLHRLYITYNISPEYIVTGEMKKDIMVELEEYIMNCNKEEQIKRACKIMEEIMKLLVVILRKS